MVRQVGLLATVVFSLAAFTLAVVFGSAVNVLLGVAVGFVWGAVHAYGARQRDHAVRTLVCLAYRSGADRVGLRHLGRVLGTPDVLEARSDALKAEAKLLAQRYANGDASDY